MPDHALIGNPLRSTPAGLKSRPGVPRELPDDLLQQASKRLQILCLVAAVLWILGPVFGHLAFWVTTRDPRWLQLGPVDYIALVSCAVSIALALHLRRVVHDPKVALDLGLAFMVLSAFAIGMMMHLGPVSDTPPVISPMLTWVCPVILMFAAVVPTTPMKMLVAGFAAASMDPLGMHIWKMLGNYDYGPVSNLLVMHYPNYMVLGIAVVISHVVTRLGQQVTKAREMGSYQVGELIGRGGMGEVYRATHRMLARPAAIKLIRPEMTGAGDGEAAQTAIRRFRREAEVAASLRSPHTVDLYDFGLTEDQTLYFVMEFLEGLDLETLVRRYGPIPAARAIFILLQVCESLEEAHERGLVHRDIKPANIHLGLMGVRSDFVKVLDFGLVKSVIGTTGEHSLATQTGLTPGTPAYMAPEMALGEDVDGRSDLYALGCVGYYLLTSQLVFDGATTVQVIAKHLQDQPVPPSRRTELEVPAALDAVVLACLAKSPDDRPPSARELARRLAAIPLREPWNEDRAAQWWKVNHPKA